jgi:hypothetical protein
MTSCHGGGSYGKASKCRFLVPVRQQSVAMGFQPVKDNENSHHFFYPNGEDSRNKKGK